MRHGKENMRRFRERHKNDEEYRRRQIAYQRAYEARHPEKLQQHQEKMNEKRFRFTIREIERMDKALRDLVGPEFMDLSVINKNEIESGFFKFIVKGRIHNEYMNEALPSW